MNEFMPGRGSTYRLIIERILETDGIDLPLPSDSLEILATVSGKILRVALPAIQPGVGFLRNLSKQEPVVIAVRDALGQRLFRAVKKGEESGGEPENLSVRFVFSLIG